MLRMSHVARPPHLIPNPEHRETWVGVWAPVEEGDGAFFVALGCLDGSRAPLFGAVGGLSPWILEVCQTQGQGWEDPYQV